MGIEAYIIHFGYIVILVATFFAGESILVLAGFLAHRGYLSFYLVVCIAFLGSLTSDQLYFYLGRTKGLAYLDKFPSWKAKSERILKLIAQHQNYVILLFRFIYGVRTVTPFLVGVSGVPSLKYFILNALGALVWALTLSSLGYVFGHTAELLLGDIKKYEFIIMGLIIVVGLVALLIHLLVEGKEKN